jgi:hypothetical protein
LSRIIEEGESTRRTNEAPLYNITQHQEHDGEEEELNRIEE